MAVELLATMTQEQAAAKMGVSVRTIQNYSAGSRGTGRRPGAPNDVNVARPRCSCGLSLFTPEELASGQCNDHLPTSAIAFMGRRDEPVITALGW
jgi:transcriptional regulator with XRE-family HTH domain